MTTMMLCRSGLTCLRTLAAALLTVLLLSKNGSAFSFLSMAQNKEIYNIPNSGWENPQWRWGYAVGTGHDCALVCRRRFSDHYSRSALVDELRNPSSDGSCTPFEEVKLVLALAWQRGERDGSDGGSGGYGEVLEEMAQAERYEKGSEEECSRLLIQDMSERFHLLHPTDEDKLEMRVVVLQSEEDYNEARRKCAGLVLDAMGFVVRGL